MTVSGMDTAAFPTTTPGRIEPNVADIQRELEQLRAENAKLLKALGKKRKSRASAPTAGKRQAPWNTEEKARAVGM